VDACCLVPLIGACWPSGTHCLVLCSYIFFKFQVQLFCCFNFYYSYPSNMSFMNTKSLLCFFGPLLLPMLRHFGDEFIGLWTLRVLPSFLFSSLSHMVSFFAGCHVEHSTCGGIVMDCLILFLVLVITEVILDDFFGTHMIVVVFLLMGDISFQEALYRVSSQFFFFTYFVGCGHGHVIFDVRMFAMFFFVVLFTNVLSSSLARHSSFFYLRGSFSRLSTVIALSWCVWSSNIVYFQVHVHSLHPIVCQSFPDNFTSLALHFGLPLVAFLAGNYVLDAVEQLVEYIRWFARPKKLECNNLHYE
jgi:hypothetical protein